MKKAMIIAGMLLWPGSTMAEDQVALAAGKVASAVAGADLPKSTYDPDEPIRHSHRPAPPRPDPKMEDAVRNGLSLSVSTCFNVYTQNASVVGQDGRLERCLASVMASYVIAQRFLAKMEVSDGAGR